MDLLLPDLGILFWTLIVFVIVIIILKKFAWKHIIGGLQQRENTIATALAQADAMKLEMAQMKNENEKLLQEARNERTKIIKDAKDIGDKMIGDARQQAAQQASKIVSDAQASIEQQKNAAIGEIKNKVGAMVIDLSEKVLKKQLDSDVKQQDYINNLTHNLQMN